MPDDDKLPRSLSARWHRVLKAFQAGEAQEAIEHHVAKAAAETLRRPHGVPELPALGAQMHLDAATGQRLALTSPDTAALLLARRVVAEVVYAFGLDRMAPVLMGYGFDPVELRHLSPARMRMPCVHMVWRGTIAGRLRNA